MRVLPETLRHLSRQSVPEHIPWEVIAVDNASTDRTADVAREVWSTYGSPVPLRVVDERVPGVSAAREKGYEEASYEFIIYCDDDNWLGTDYVRLVYELMMEHPSMGAVGGQGRAVGETELPGWFERYARYYAVGPQGDRRGDVSDAKGYLYGAGLSVRRSVLSQMKRLGVTRRLSDKKPGTLVSGGDDELGYLIRLMGYGLWYDPRLEFSHFLPSGRLRWKYFLALVEGAHRVRPYLDAYRLVLKGEAGGPGTWRWIAECWKIVWRVLRRPEVLVAAIADREGSGASYLWHRSRSEWIGWWTMGSEHGALRRELVREYTHDPVARAEAG